MKKKYTIYTFIFGLSIGCLFGFTADKFVTIKFSEATLNYHWKNLQNIKAVVDQSSLPHTQVKFAMAAIDSLQSDIATQVRPQLETAPTAVKK